MKPAICDVDVASIKTKIIDLQENVIPKVRDLSPRLIGLVEGFGELVNNALDTNVEFWTFAPYVVGMGLYCSLLEAIDLVIGGASGILSATNATQELIIELGIQAFLGYTRVEAVMAQFKDNISALF